MEQVKNLKVEERSSSNQEYDLIGQGQFVLVSNTTYGYEFGDDGMYLKWLRMFEHNRDKLITSLELSGNDSAIILCDPRPTRSGGFIRKKYDDTLSFYEMMGELCNPEKPSPSFLIFVLQGHGDEDGNIYLGHKNGCNEGCRHRSSNQCLYCSSCSFCSTCSSCSRVNINRQVIKKIQDSKRFIGKPKIFIIDRCRGPNLPRAFSKGGDEEQREYWPEGADTFIARSTLQDMKALGLTHEGSYFVNSFCEEFEKLKSKCRSKAENLTEFDVLRSEIHQFFQPILFHVAMEVSAVNAKGEVLSKQQPEITHTLNKRLLLSKLIATMTPPSGSGDHKQTVMNFS